MSTEENKKIVLRWREERNKGNWNIIDELHAPDYVLHIQLVPGGAIRGREALKHLFIGYWAAFDVYATPQPDFLTSGGRPGSKPRDHSRQTQRDVSGDSSDGEGSDHNQHGHLPDCRRQDCRTVDRIRWAWLDAAARRHPCARTGQLVIFVAQFTW
jgi:hypothetical protein